MKKKKILVTGGDGRFAKILKKNNKKLKLKVRWGSILNLQNCVLTTHSKWTND